MPVLLLMQVLKVVPQRVKLLQLMPPLRVVQKLALQRERQVQ